MKIRKSSLLHLGLIAALVGLALPARAEKVKFGHIAPPFHGQSKGVEAFADYVREKTGGRIDIATFPLGQLGGERSMASSCQAGVIPITAITTAVLQNFVPEVGVLDLPFLFSSLDNAHATLDDPAVMEKLFSYSNRKGLVSIGWCEDGLRSFFAKRTLRTPEDFKGLKVRVMESPAYLATFEAFGAKPVGIPFPEVYNALQTGVIDAAEASLLVGSLMRFPEVTKHVTDSEYAMAAVIVVVNREYWEGLSPADQQIFREAAALCTRVNREVNAQLNQKMPKQDISVAQYLAGKEAEVARLSDAERKVLREAATPVWDTYRNKLGTELVDFVEAKAQAHR